MSVWVKGMKMPASCAECPMNYDSIDCSVNLDIALRDKENEFIYGDGRHKDCPLIEVFDRAVMIDHKIIMDADLVKAMAEKLPKEAAHELDVR